MRRMDEADVVVVGGGIVGLATADRFTLRHPGRRVVVLEKEADLAVHQTGHNSGVIHSGIYYKPGSLKAENCRRGKRLLEQFCREESLAFETCGKVIVAVDPAEDALLDRLYERGKANGVDCSLIDEARLRELEPHVAGRRAIHVPEAGIVDYRAVCRRLAERVVSHGGRVYTQARVTALARDGERVVVE